MGIIMKRPVTKIAAAAVIVVAAALVILHESPAEKANTTYAQMCGNMQKMQWVHIITKDIVEGKDVEMEKWYSDGENVIALKKPGGELEFSDYKKGKSYIYDPNTQVISLSFIEENDYAKNALPLQDGIDSMLSMLTKLKADIDRHSGEFQGQKVEIYEIQYQVEKITVNGKINVNPKSRLPLFCEYKTTDADGNQATNRMQFKFPQSGPKDIYNMGAPASAKAPAEDLLEVLDTYLSNRKNSPQRYIAIITEDQWYMKTWTLDIIYKDGKIKRKETRTTDEFKQQWEKYSGQKDVPFESLLELARKGGKEYNSIELYVDGKFYRAYRSKNLPWKISEQSSSGPDRLARDDLTGLGWPVFSDMQNEGTIIENDHSRINNLICIQQLRQGEKMPEGRQEKVHMPSRYLYYFNPERDYICERIEYYSVRNAPWQKDKSWLDEVESYELQPDTRNITEVMEYRQTEGGRWYPYKIEFKVSSYDSDIGALRPYSINSVKTIYLNTEPEFPQGIFDPNQVTHLDKNTEATIEQNYDDAFKEAIEIIDSRQDWPQPRELVEKYWQARANKDYDAMAIFWPGSAAWNRKNLEDEEPVEYVFGEEQKTDKDKLNIPYATKSSYEKNGTYNLTMRLTNEKSAQGRYYIVSGN
jgi:hypothetical protein